jgi:hypothetical protein
MKQENKKQQLRKELEQKWIFKKKDFERREMFRNNDGEHNKARRCVILSTCRFVKGKISPLFSLLDLAQE